MDKVPRSRKRKPSERLLGLEELTKTVRPSSSHYLGIRDVPVAAIIGSENRSAYFGEDFLPLFRWMDKRWLIVRDKLLSGELTEPIQVFEYGGYYFVRDGNHRVSVAKTENIEFLSAEVTVLDIPIRLCPCMTRKMIPIFREKYRLQNETGIFNVLPDEIFEVKRYGTWSRLKVHIFVGHRNWMIARDGKVPDNERLFLDWNIELYENTVNEIRRNRLYDLYPGYGATDIFCEIMDFWKDNPGWMNDVYDALIRKRERKDILTFLRYRFGHFFKKFALTAAEEKDRFFTLSRLLIFRPLAEVPEGGKSWYEFLTGQLFGVWFNRLKERLGRYPEMSELTANWYDEMFEPVLKEYKETKTAMPFRKYYRRKSRQPSKKPQK